jgi:hypothetical protein
MTLSVTSAAVAIFCSRHQTAKGRRLNVVPRQGFEPRTLCLEGRCSIH